jgi:hypothetical protein
MSWVDSPGPSLQAYLDQNTSILPMHLTDQSHFWELNIPPGFDWAGWRHPRYEIAGSHSSGKMTAVAEEDLFLILRCDIKIILRVIS